jgi:hypothetical protein
MRRKHSTLRRGKAKHVCLRQLPPGNWPSLLIWHIQFISSVLFLPPQAPSEFIPQYSIRQKKLLQFPVTKSRCLVELPSDLRLFLEFSQPASKELVVLYLHRYQHHADFGTDSQSASNRSLRDKFFRKTSLAIFWVSSTASIPGISSISPPSLLRKWSSAYAAWATGTTLRC